LCVILGLLKDSAADEESTGFDLSGSGGAAPTKTAILDNGSTDQVDSSAEFTTRTHVTDATNITPNLSSLGLEDRDESGSEFWGSQNFENGSGLNELDRVEKEDRLKDMFPSLGAYTISHSLKKCNGNIDRAMDMLLNLVYFEEEDSKSGNEVKLAPKGVDGFAERQNAKKARKRKYRKARVHEEDGPSSSSSGSGVQGSSTAAENKWELGRKDVEFVISRTLLTQDKVYSVYHYNHASLAATIHSLATTEMQTPTTDTIPQTAVETQITELAWTFHTIPTPKLAALLRLTRHSPSAARDLAQVMTRMPDHVHDAPEIQTLPTYSLIDFRSEDNVVSHSSNRYNADASVLRAQAAYHGTMGSAAFTQASAAYRRGRSQPLMGLASQYYAEEGRKHAKDRAELDAAAAEAQVRTNASSTQIDLHGISVPNAVRIAKDMVRQWWDGLGDAKYAPGGGGPVRKGYEIVVGKGNHSRPGAPKVGPAVLKQLTAEGWRVEVGNGFLRVTGRMRR